MSTYLVRTLGCKANLYDSQMIEKTLQEQGWSPSGEGADGGAGICIINSCTVTNEADQQTRKLAARLAKENPNAKVIVTGCGAEVDPEGMAQAPGVDAVIGNQNKDKLIELINSSISSHILNLNPVLGTVTNYEELRSKHPMDREWPAVVDSFHTPPVHLKGHSDKTRSFLKIQEGCNSFCTYCIIPYGRGPSRSMQPDGILKQTSELVARGVREIVLTGTNIGDYGTDWGGEPQLDMLIERILQETALERLRVSSLDPTEITPKIFQLMETYAQGEKGPQFCPHFHVSLQSPSTKILRLMKRRYGFEEVRTCLEQISRTFKNQAFVGMDLITGFPGESDEDFETGFEALAALPWTRLHVFPYSERSGTPATRLPHSVPHAKRVARARRLNKLSMDRLTAHYQRVLKECIALQTPLHSVLMEKAGDWDWVAGYTPNYLRVLLPKAQALSLRNELVTVMPSEIMLDSRGQDVALIASLVKAN